jgi:hypothetical protein
MHNVCRTGGDQEMLERLIPTYVTLSEDSMYRVRRACAENMTEMAKCAPVSFCVTDTMW